MNYHKITYPDIENGTGCRVTLWVAGCPHHCPGCHNPETWGFKSGKPFTPEAMATLMNILELPYIQGLTLSGGDPLAIDNLVVISKLVSYVKEHYPTKDIWIYTGFTWEFLIDSPYYQNVLKNSDVIVEGPFIQNQRDITLAFRGSTNQRVVDVQKSLKENKLIEYVTY